MPQRAHTFTTSATPTTSLEYWLALPPDYADNVNAYPLILFLHGAGERSENGLEAVKKHGIPKIIDKKHKLPFIVLSPQCPQDTWWSTHEVALLALLDDICATYRVDTKRIYLTGLSMGGFGTWHLGFLYPERFAALAPVCGGMPWFVSLASAAERMQKLPIWAFHGAKDDVVILEESQRVVRALEAKGSNVKLKVYRKATHDSWTKTYDNPKLYKWFLKHSL